MVFGEGYWIRKDSGWYTHPQLGSVHREWGKWYWYPKGPGVPLRIGTFKTKNASIDHAEREGRKR